MLLLFLSIFFQYHLLHCGKKANGKEVFMDYSITEIWWKSTPGIDQTERILNADREEQHLIVFLIELTRLTATKEKEAVRNVVKHTNKIIYDYYRRGQLLWLGTPLIDITRDGARFLKESDIDVIQKHAANLHHMLSQRNQMLPVEVNTILEDADMLYDNDDGRLLLDSLKEFVAFPNISLTSYWVCNSLIHNFLRPFQRLKGRHQRQELVDSVNLLLKTRLYSDSSPDETKLAPQKELVTQKVPHSNNIRSPRKIKRKRHHRSHKRKRERKRYTDTKITLK